MNEMRKLMEAVDYSPEGDIVASADEFIVVHEHGMIHILDGEQTVRLSMPWQVWNDLRGYDSVWQDGYNEGYEQAKNEQDMMDYSDRVWNDLED